MTLRGIVAVTKSGSMERAGRDWPDEAATRLTLSSSAPGGGHQRREVIHGQASRSPTGTVAIRPPILTGPINAIGTFISTCLPIIHFDSIAWRTRGRNMIKRRGFLAGAAPWELSPHPRPHPSQLRAVSAVPDRVCHSAGSVTAWWRRERRCRTLRWGTRCGVTCSLPGGRA